MHWYCAYGLRIVSDLAIPAQPCEPGTADVTIRVGQRRAPGAESQQSGARGISDDEICCYWKPAGIFHIRGGREILIEPDADADDTTIIAWLQGAAISLLLHQRGLLVLHSSAVAINGQAVAFVGEVGWGKSTTAAAFHAQGHRLLTDDVVAVDFSTAVPTVVPAFPIMKLLPEAVKHFGTKQEELHAIVGEDEKKLRLLDGPFEMTPFPLRAVYVLGEGDRCFIEPLDGQTALLQIIRHSFVARATQFLQKSNTMKSHFAHCTQLVNSAEVGYLRRPRALELLPKLVEVVEQRWSDRKTRAGA